MRLDAGAGRAPSTSAVCWPLRLAQGHDTGARSPLSDTTRQACSTSPGDRAHSPSVRPNTGPAAVYGVAVDAGTGPVLADARIRGTALNSSGAIPHSPPPR